MRGFLATGAALALTTLLAFPASAATLPVNATLSFTLGALGGPTLTGSGIGQSSGRFLGASIPAGLLSQTVTSTIPIPELGNQDFSLSLITVPAGGANAAGSFAPGGGGNGGVMGNSFVANFFFTNGQPGGSVSLDPIGGAGTAMGAIAALPVTVYSAAWTDLGVSATTPTKTIQVMKSPAGIPYTVTATAFDNRTAGGLGTLQLVVPTSAQIFQGLLEELPIVGVLTLQFVPEPGTLVLVGSGVIGLVAFGRKRASA
jgi:hypothetical protein